MWHNSDKNVIKIKFSCILESTSVKMCNKAQSCVRQSTKINVITEYLENIFFYL